MIALDEITKKDGKPVVRLHGQSYRGYIAPTDGDRDRSAIVAKPGDKFAVGGREFIVAKIVPVDEKRKIIGWVELAYQKKAEFPPQTLTFTANRKEKPSPSLLEIPRARYQLDETSGGSAVAVHLSGDLAEVAGSKNGISVDDHWKTTASGGDVLPLFGFVYKMLPIEKGTATTKLIMRRVAPRTCRRTCASIPRMSRCWPIPNCASREAIPASTLSN